MPLWKALIEQKVSRGKVSAAFGSDGFVNRMWERLAVTKKVARKWLEEATKAVPLETTRSWQTESPYIEELELLRASSDLRLDGTVMRQASQAGW